MKSPAVLALTGGVGGAKLALGLYRILPPASLGLAINTGDDFTHLGLAISPDLDTLLYTLAGISNPDAGWGRKDETWACFDELRRLGAPTWFQLGDRDLALHLFRSHRLACGAMLSEVTAALARQHGIHADIWPMSDLPVRTMLGTDEGELSFQDYFVNRRCVPRVQTIRYAGSADATPLPALLDALHAPGLEAIVICPSNPYLSIDPMLAIPALRTALLRRRVPCIAVSPLVDGKAVKGPTAKLMSEMGIPANTASIAAHYRGLIDGLVTDYREPALVAPPEIEMLKTDTLMSSLEDRDRLAGETLRFARELSHRTARESG